MTDPDPTHVVLELAGGGEPIHGSIRLGEGAAQPFFGYIELIAALERVRGSDQGTIPRGGTQCVDGSAGRRRR